MYCVNCGVELQKGVDKCPLCGIRVYHPDINEESEPGPYPAYSQAEEPDVKVVLFILSAVMIIPVILCLAIDLRIKTYVTWSGYVAGGMTVAYFSAVFPMWFKKRNPVIFFPAAMCSVILFVLYICLHTGGRWFLSFAFPVLGFLMVLVETVIVLIKYVVKKKNHRTVVVLGGGAIGLGLLCVLIETMIHFTFGVKMIWWSVIPLIVQSIIGALMIIVGSNKKMRESFYKRFFI